MSSTSIQRLDNNLWQYSPPELTLLSNDILLSHIQIQTPSFSEPACGYAVASAVAQTLGIKKISTLSQLNEPLFLTIESRSPKVSGHWKVAKITHSSICDKLKQCWPFTKMYPDRTIVRIEASKVATTDAVKAVIADVAPLVILSQSRECPSMSINRRLEAQSFTDPFTQLATLYLQTVDPNFVSEEKVLASFRFVLKDDTLVLKPLTGAPPTHDEMEENRQTVQAFQAYILTEFGKKRLDYVNSAYGFSLETLIQQGDALTPDHVFKVNIGMNNVELGDVQTLFNKLLQFRKSPPESTKSYLIPENFENNTCLSIAEFRALLKLTERVYPDVTRQEGIMNFLNTLPESEVSVKLLDPQMFNTLVSLVMPDSEARERAFTGRKITHLAIMGSNTMGNPDIFNPSRDLFELMHLYKQMQKPQDWRNYFELLTHVAAKKTLFRKTAPAYQKPHQRHWHVGILLPAPSTLTGEARWYYNEACYDDGQGNVNYKLVPACDNYRFEDKALPFIKNYRSTATNANAFDALESIAADLNPYGSPGPIDAQDSFQMEKGDFFERTIPLWVAKLLHAEKESAPELYQEALSEYIFFLEHPGNTPQNVLYEAYRLKQVVKDPEKIRAFLRQEAEFHKELPEHKISQDIACIGHSLGGALAQFGIYFFTSRLRRVPLEGNNFICYASRAPAIDRGQDAQFMQFGQKHARMLQALKTSWQIIYDFASGDFIPQSGHSHLGTTGYSDADSAWCRTTISVFQPQETATALEITTAVAHARRTGNAQEGLDFTRTMLQPKDLYTYDHAWILPRPLREVFDYRCCLSSKVTEFGREVLARITRPLIVVAEKFPTSTSAPQIRRNGYGGFALHY